MVQSYRCRCRSSGGENDFLRNLTCLPYRAQLAVRGSSYLILSQLLDSNYRYVSLLLQVLRNSNGGVQRDYSSPLTMSFLRGFNVFCVRRVSAVSSFHWVHSRTPALSTHSARHLNPSVPIFVAYRYRFNEKHTEPAVIDTRSNQTIPARETGLVRHFVGHAEGSDYLAG